MRAALANDPLQAVERLLDRRARGTAHQLAPRLGKSPRRDWASSIVTFVALPVGPSRRSSVSAAESRRAKGVSSTCWDQRSTRAALVVCDDAEVCAHLAPAWALEDLGEGVGLDPLDALHARPPARQVVRIDDQLPEILRGRGDRAGAARGRHATKPTRRR